MKFSPCVPNQCTEEGTHCEGCGRSHEEIAETKTLISNLVDFSKKLDYDNPEEFVNFVSSKTLKKLQS